MYDLVRCRCYSCFLRFGWTLSLFSSCHISYRKPLIFTIQSDETDQDEFDDTKFFFCVIINIVKVCISRFFYHPVTYMKN